MANLKLESAIGITGKSPLSLLSLEHGMIFFAAGAVAVKYDLAADKQLSHLISLNSPKPISCFAKSSDGFVAVAEIGLQPKILIYNIKTDKLESSIIGHKYGVSACQFSPDNQFLVSVGINHDGVIFVWDWRKAKKIAAAKTDGSPIYSMSFSPKGDFFVTTGIKHFKIWSMSRAADFLESQRQPEGIMPVVIEIEGKSAYLAEHQGITIVDVKCILSDGKPRIYCLSSDGVFLMFNSEGYLEKWLHTKMQRGSCLSYHESLNAVICAGSQGKIRLFECETLKHIGNLPIAKSGATAEKRSMVVSLQYQDQLLSVLYSDMKIVVFRLGSNLKEISIENMLKNHSDCVWGVKAFAGADSAHDGFITYSSDGTIRFWDSGNLMKREGSGLHKISPQLISTLIADFEGLLKFQNFDRFGSSNDIKSVTERIGIRSIAVDPSNSMLACGDRNGNIGIFLLDSFKKVGKIEAHDAEIMTLDFALVGKSLILASASRDRLIHIFDANPSPEGTYPFKLLQTLDDHSSTLTFMSFADSGARLISSGADKAIIFRSIQDETSLAFATYSSTFLKSTVYDFCIGQISRTLATTSQDRKITLLDLDSGKPRKSFATNASDEMDKPQSSNTNFFLNTIATDPTGSIICAGASDKSVRLIDTQTGISLFQGVGHGDYITDVSFINEGAFIASTSADGCVFIWNTPISIIEKMGFVNGATVNTKIPSNSDSSPASLFRFDESHLPKRVDRKVKIFSELRAEDSNEAFETVIPPKMMEQHNETVQGDKAIIPGPFADDIETDSDDEIDENDLFPPNEKDNMRPPTHSFEFNRSKSVERPQCEAETEMEDMVRLVKKTAERIAQLAEPDEVEKMRKVYMIARDCLEITDNRILEKLELYSDKLVDVVKQKLNIS